MSILIITAYLLAIFVGISLSLLGAGGSILTVPILTYLLKMPLNEAIPSSLLIVGITSIVAAIPHWQKKNIRFKEALVFLIFSSLGSWIGAKLAFYIPGNIRLYIFIFLMLTASLNMLISKEDTKQAIKTKSILLSSLVAFLVGTLTGLVGIGGGFMIVPALNLLLSFPIRQAIATSLLIKAINAFTAFISYTSQIHFNWNKLSLLILFTLIGALIGVPLNKQIQTTNLKNYFSLMLLLVAVFMLYKTFYVN
jgi:uncharacterized membrane protein YfcA